MKFEKTDQASNHANLADELALRRMMTPTTLSTSALRSGGLKGEDEIGAVYKPFTFLDDKGMPVANVSTASVDGIDKSRVDLTPDSPTITTSPSDRSIVAEIRIDLSELRSPSQEHSPHPGVEIFMHMYLGKELDPRAMAEAAQVGVSESDRFSIQFEAVRTERDNYCKAMGGGLTERGFGPNRTE